MSLSQWPGPVDESKAPYVNDKNNYPKFLDADLNYLNTEYAMKDAVFLPAQDTEGMKQAIITNGSVSASYASEGMGALDKYFTVGVIKQTMLLPLSDMMTAFQENCLEIRSRRRMERGS